MRKANKIVVAAAGLVLAGGAAAAAVTAPPEAANKGLDDRRGAHGDGASRLEGRPSVQGGPSRRWRCHGDRGGR